MSSIQINKRSKTLVTFSGEFPKKQESIANRFAHSYNNVIYEGVCVFSMHLCLCEFSHGNVFATEFRGVTVSGQQLCLTVQHPQELCVYCLTFARQQWKCWPNHNIQQICRQRATYGDDLPTRQVGKSLWSFFSVLRRMYTKNVLSCCV